MSETWYPSKKQKEERRQRQYRERCPECEKWVIRDPLIEHALPEKCPNCGHAYKKESASTGIQKWASGWNSPRLPGRVYKNRKQLTAALSKEEREMYVATRKEGDDWVELKRFESYGEARQWAKKHHPGEHIVIERI